MAKKNFILASAHGLIFEENILLAKKAHGLISITADSEFLVYFVG
jgi:hypothetical protein